MLIERLRLQNILSFRDTTVKLGKLNILIGPNGVGKSNLIEAIGLLQALPTGLAPAIMRGGGIRQWLWLGEDLPVTASIECDLRLRGGGQFGTLSYRLDILGDGSDYRVQKEELTAAGELAPTLYLSRDLQDASIFDGRDPRGAEMQLHTTASILALYRHPADPTPITELGKELDEVQILREFRTGPRAMMRQGISTATARDGLPDGADNLAMVLQDFNFRGLSDRVNKLLKRFCERFGEVKVDIGDGLARTYLSESGLKSEISAARMSDGTLKFLALLTAILNPKAPPMICIEEPELGLHPDAMHIVAELLLEASERTQLIVTTHSEALIDAFTDHPESVLVCERDCDNGTQMKRLSKKRLAGWLERYRLGELWRKGQIGGVRF